MEVFMFGSCRIEQPLQILENKNIISGIKRKELSIIYTTQQLIQHLKYVNKELEIKNLTELINIFFKINPNPKYREDITIFNEKRA